MIAVIVCFDLIDLDPSNTAERVVILIDDNLDEQNDNYLRKMVERMTNNV